MADPRIEDLTRLRALYGRRGPRDGELGLTPDGRVAVSTYYRLEAVVADCDAAMRLQAAPWSQWRAAMGLPQERASLWSDKCPARGPSLAHARTAADPPGACVHCKGVIG